MIVDLWIPLGGLLGAIAPLGLAAAAGTALVVDADPTGPNYPGSASVADLVGAGPRREDLQPTRSGVAVLRNGGVTYAEAEPVIAALSERWPAIVVRHSGMTPPTPAAVSVTEDLPGALALRMNALWVLQRLGWGKPSVDADVLLPPPSRALIRALLGGTQPGPSRWVRAWKPVWTLK